MNIKQEKRCIVHIPNHIEKSGKSGSNIRPIKMKQAFEENGYLVEYISGYGTERKVQINKIKRNIRNGIKYDFLYSESSTMPTLLTEKNHLPRYPFLDFSFFKFCKKNGIKIDFFIEIYSGNFLCIVIMYHGIRSAFRFQCTDMI